MGTKRGQEKKARDSDDSGKGEVDRVKGTIRPVHGHMWIESGRQRRQKVQEERANFF